jgi:hypothetical protein
MLLLALILLAFYRPHLRESMARSWRALSNYGPGRARAAARRDRAEPDRRPDHNLRRLDVIRHIHIIWFSCWIALGVEKYPYGLLTMIVSLEAIFLSTFVMISQNRADAKRQVIADQQWQTVKEEDTQNQQLLDLSNQILKLTKEVHTFTSTPSNGTGHTS